MKRLIAVVLAMLMLCACAAQAAEWADGTSPSQPYSNQPAMDLTKNIGYMMFYPNSIATVETACQRLFIYMPREDVEAGDGTLSLYTEKGGKVWSTEMDDTEAITQRPITEAELTGLMWGGGTCFEILLPRSLDLNKDYYVNMTRNCIVSEDGAVDNPAVEGTSIWRFNIGGEYGVEGMEYLRDGETTLTPASGDSIRFDLTLGGDAVSAVVYGYNDSVNFLTTMFSENCVVTGSVDGSAPSWGVAFRDAEGNEIERVDFY